MKIFCHSNKFQFEDFQKLLMDKMVYLKKHIFFQSINNEIEDASHLRRKCRKINKNLVSWIISSLKVFWRDVKDCVVVLE